MGGGGQQYRGGCWEGRGAGYGTPGLCCNCAYVEVSGALGDGQLAIQLGDLGGQKGWRLGLIRLTAGDLAPTVSAACVASEARAKRGRMFRVMALVHVQLAVDEEMRPGDRGWQQEQ